MGRFYTLLSLLLEITESEYNDKCQNKQYSLENIENRKSIEYIKKSHTCEEGGAHLRISVWHWLMNLKNKYFLKNCSSWSVKNKLILLI